MNQRKTYKSIMFLITLIILLSSCHNATDVATPTPPATQSPPSTSPPAANTYTIPEHPFPEYTPYTERWFSSELRIAFDDGLVFAPDNTLMFYQPWYAFMQKADKGKEAALRIYTTEIRQDRDTDRMHWAAGRFYLSYQDGNAQWYDFIENSVIYGELSVAYDPENGRHDVYVGEDRVLQFDYFPPDPTQLALFWGYTPLEDLPEQYTKENALADGCLVIHNGKMLNEDMLIKLKRDLQLQDNGTFIRIFIENSGGITITDAGSYSGRSCVTADTTRRSDIIDGDIVTNIYDNSYIKIGEEDDRHCITMESEYIDRVYVFKHLPITP